MLLNVNHLAFGQYFSAEFFPVECLIDNLQDPRDDNLGRVIGDRPEGPAPAPAPQGQGRCPRSR